MGKVATFLLAAVLPLALSAQQTLTLRDGTQFRGRMISATDTSIAFQDENGDRHRFHVSNFNPWISPAEQTAPVTHPTYSNKTRPAPARTAIKDIGDPRPS